MSLCLRPIPSVRPASPPPTIVIGFAAFTRRARSFESVYLKAASRTPRGATAFRRDELRESSCCYGTALDSRNSSLRSEDDRYVLTVVRTSSWSADVLCRFSEPEPATPIPLFGLDPPSTL